jgi:hypothetical protein
MADNMFKQISKQKWYRWSFYINIVLFFIIALFVYLLVIDSINAGMRWGSDPNALLSVARDIAFLAIALALVFFQFFRNLMTIIRRTL